MQDDNTPKNLGERIRVILVWYILPAVVFLTLIKFIGSGMALPIAIFSLAIIGLAAVLIYAYRNELIDKYRTLSLSSRLYLWGCGFWCFLVLSYVLTFDPFGYMYDSDWYTVWKIILFPPMLIGLGHYSYLKLVRTSK